MTTSRREWYLANRERLIKKAGEWKKNNREKNKLSNRKSDLKRLYGLSWEGYNNILVAQNNCCAICGLPLGEVICVDHCHTTNKVRGLVHRDCNRAIGLLKDDHVILRQAADYLERHHATRQN